jgi:short-subunit dehydrogenase
MIQDIRGRRTLVTGASRGLGAHIAKMLAARGAELVLSARDASMLEEMARACEREGAKVQTIAADLARADDRARLIDEAGELDILINNAGIEVTVAFTEQTPADIEAQLAINLAAPLDLTARVLPQMIERKRGVIVNLSSMSGKSPTPYNSVYTATKHALCGFSMTLGIELRGTGVHVGTVCPSFVADAGMWADHGVKAPKLMREVRPERVSKAVLKVIGGAQEVLVTPGPVRPLLALGQLFPSATRRFLSLLGVTPVLAQRAEVSAARRRAAPSSDEPPVARQDDASKAS